MAANDQNLAKISPDEKLLSELHKSLAHRTFDKFAEELREIQAEQTPAQFKAILDQVNYKHNERNRNNQFEILGLDTKDNTVAVKTSERVLYLGDDARLVRSQSVRDHDVAKLSKDELGPLEINNSDLKKTLVRPAGLTGLTPGEAQESEKPWYAFWKHGPSPNREVVTKNSPINTDSFGYRGVALTVRDNGESYPEAFSNNHSFVGSETINRKNQLMSYYVDYEPAEKKPFDSHSYKTLPAFKIDSTRNPIFIDRLAGQYNPSTGLYDVRLKYSLGFREHTGSESLSMEVTKDGSVVSKKSGEVCDETLFVNRPGDDRAGMKFDEEGRISWVRHWQHSPRTDFKYAENGSLVEVKSEHLGTFEKVTEGKWKHTALGEELKPFNGDIYVRADGTLVFAGQNEQTEYNKFSIVTYNKYGQLVRRADESGATDYQSSNGVMIAPKWTEFKTGKVRTFSEEARHNFDPLNVIPDNSSNCKPTLPRKI